MANKSLFSSLKNRRLRADARNEAGGPAYRLPPKHALAQLAATGCFGGVFYASAEDQLAELRALVDQVDDNVYLAKLAVYSRQRAYMKDMPAALLLVLARRDSRLFHRAFDRVVDNGRVLRTLFQMLRSGQFGRKSLSSSLQRAFQRWLNAASVNVLLSASIGRDPSLRRNPESIIVPFDTRAYQAKLDPQDTILSLAERLAKYGGGGTDCSLPLREGNTNYRERQFAGVVLVSDTESWVCGGRPFGRARARPQRSTDEAG